ncbi:MAG: hypothetical protein OXT65_07405 [Alphaproteobacteria bacterium]|nr:hypothetical protein [Alphaproteobacteria bacterium]
MEKYVLNIDMTMCEGALVRVLSTIERRGFSVAALNMPAAKASGRSLTVTVQALSSAYKIDILMRQIARLQEVQKIEQSIATSQPRRRSAGVLRFLRKAVPHTQRAT